MMEQAGPHGWQSDRIAELLKQLHAANEHFATARRHLESMLDCADYDCPPHDRIEADLRSANAELQSISAKIHKILAEPPEKNPT